MTQHARLAVRLSAPMKQRLAALARERRVAMTAIVEAGIAAMLKPEANPEPSVTARLNRVLRELREMQQSMEVLEETLGLFINVYLSTTPEVPPEQEETARRNGGRRYARFLKVLEGKLAREKGARYADHPAPDSGGPRA